MECYSGDSINGGSRAYVLQYSIVRFCSGLSESKAEENVHAYVLAADHDDCGLVLCDSSAFGPKLAPPTAAISPTPTLRIYRLLTGLSLPKA